MDNLYFWKYGSAGEKHGVQREIAQDEKMFRPATPWEFELPGPNKLGYNVLLAFFAS